MLISWNRRTCRRWWVVHRQPLELASRVSGHWVLGLPWGSPLKRMSKGCAWHRNERLTSWTIPSPARPAAERAWRQEKITRAPREKPGGKQNVGWGNYLLMRRDVPHPRVSLQSANQPKPVRLCPLYGVKSQDRNQEGVTTVLVYHTDQGKTHLSHPRDHIGRMTCARVFGESAKQWYQQKK